MGSDIECKQTAQMCKAASDDRSPMAIDFASIDDGNSATEIVKIPVHITEADFIGGARQILDVLRPTWSSENIRFKLFTDGITNKLVGCYHRPSTATATNNSSSTSPSSPSCNITSSCQTALPSGVEVVLIRIYGRKTEMLIDRQTETRNIKMLQSHGFAPRLYAVFHNGLAYEYVPGVTLTPATVVAERVWPLVARHMAKMHRLAVRAASSTSSSPSTVASCPAADEAAAPQPFLAPKVRSFLDLLPARFANAEHEKRIRSLGVPDVEQLRSDFESLYKRLRSLGSPVVFAHNDLLLGNVIYEEATDRVAFIDYEYAAHNYQAYDIGNHFAEFAGIDEIDYRLYPSREFQYAWLRVYAEAYAGDGVAVSDSDVHRLYVQVNAFALASHYFWAVWGLIQTEHSTIDFDFIRFATSHYQEYLDRKDEFLALTNELER